MDPPGPVPAPPGRLQHRRPGRGSARHEQCFPSRRRRSHGSPTAFEANGLPPPLPVFGRVPPTPGPMRRAT
ncbi:MAG: hypothetical protein FIA95_06055 [Gemmatimonadetes bacterium]|nr:hypothetical protein [Gemmatimonadota bacterium]